jgi:hypothetical protein
VCERIHRSHHEIAIASINGFPDDGKLDLGELNFLLGLALRADRVDEDEKRVLANVVGKLTLQSVEPVVWQRIRAVRLKYGV